MLTRLGQVVARRPRAVIAGWVVVALVGALLAAGLSDRLANRGFYVPNSSSDHANRVQELHFADAGGSPLFVAATTERSGASSLEAAASAAATRLDNTEDVSFVGAPVVSENRRAALVPFTIDLSLEDAQHEIPDLRDSVAANPPPGVELEIVGQAAVFERYSEIAAEDLGRSESLSLPVPLAILLVAFLSVVAALLPIISAIVSLIAVVGVIALLSLVADISVFALNVASVLTIGLSIDFALFSVSRFRELRAEPHALSVNDAVVCTIATTGRAIVLSAFTVASSLLLLLLVGVGVFSSIAAGAAVASLVAGAAGLTLIPALLIKLGPWQLERFRLERLARRASSARMWRDLPSWAVRRPATAVVLSVAILVALALPLLNLTINTRPTTDLPRDDSVRDAIERVSDSFGPGAAAPVTVVTTSDRARTVGERLAADPGIRAVFERERGDAGWVRFQAAFAKDPDSPDSYDTVRRLHTTLGVGGATAYVGGQSAESVDLVDRTEERAPYVVSAVMLLGALVLALGLRSIVVPLKAVFTASLSAAAGLGVTALVFSELGDEPGLSYLVPLVLFTITFGLAIDYESFVMSRVREEYRAGRSNADSIVEGLSRTARSVTLAGLVIVPVFLAFTLGRLAPFQEMGVGLAVAVLLDTTIVRLILVPGALTLLGERNWWFPRWRGRGDSRAAER